MAERRTLASRPGRSLSALGRGRVAPLLVSRTVEQAVLGLGSLFVARAVGLEVFASIAVLLILNSLSVTLSDYGLGTDVLRMEADRRASLRELRRVRRVNAALVVPALALALLVGGDAGTVIGFGILLWGTSGESFVRRSAALREHAVPSVVRSELAGAGMLAVGMVAACYRPQVAVAAVGLSLVAKQLAEVAVVSSVWRNAFADVAPVSDTRLLWWAQVVAYSIANVDFLMLGLFQPARVFSIYVLAFRLANGLPSQLSFVVGRVLAVDFAVDSGSARQRLYDRSTSRMFALGVVGAAVTSACAVVVPRILGDDWEPIVWVLVALACAVPWRMILGIAGTLLVVAQQSGRLLVLETKHIALYGGVCALSASISVPLFVATVGVSSVIANLVYHRVAGEVVGVSPWTRLVPLAAVGVLLIAAASSQVASL